MSDGSGSGANASPMFGFARSPQDFFGGLVLIAVALFSLYAGFDLSGMHGFSFGPSTAPRIFAWLLIAFGAGVSTMVVFFEGPRLERWSAPGVILTTASILAFAVTVRPLGLLKIGGTSAPTTCGNPIRARQSQLPGGLFDHEP